MSRGASKSIITFNLSGLPSPPHARTRVKKFAELASKQSVDIINVQELHTYGLLRILKSGLKDFPYVVVIPGIIGPKAGLATFSKQPVHHQKFVKLGLHKGVVISRLQDGISIFNAHLTANTDGDWSPGNRFHKVQKRQLDAILNLAETENGRRLIVTGDLNIAKSSDLYAYFVRKGGWTDAFSVNQAPTFHQEFLPAGREPQCVDYIFSRGDTVKISAAGQLFKDKLPIRGRDGFLSNHVALIASLAFTH